MGEGTLKADRRIGGLVIEIIIKMVKESEWNAIELVTGTGIY